MGREEGEGSVDQVPVCYHNTDYSFHHRLKSRTQEKLVPVQMYMDGAERGPGSAPPPRCRGVTAPLSTDGHRVRFLAETLLEVQRWNI